MISFNWCFVIFMIFLKYFCLAWIISVLVILILDGLNFVLCQLVVKAFYFSFILISENYF